jgi:hypothetical protein
MDAEIRGMSGMNGIRFGDFVDTCQVCWNRNERFGTLVDRVGRKWLICQECIMTLWDDRQAINLSEKEKEREADAVDKALGLIREKILGENELCLTR